eukprot:1557628-Pleurochrysis_carterae.AAC.2
MRVRVNTRHGLLCAMPKEFDYALAFFRPNLRMKTTNTSLSPHELAKLKHVPWRRPFSQL